MATTRSVTHSSFTLERVYPAAPARVFAAFSDPVKKQKWFGWQPEQQRGEATLDFRVGGREHSAGSFDGETVHTFDAIYQDIVDNERIVYSYEMRLNDQRMSVSLATIELLPEGDGTRLIMTEQDAFLDGLDTGASREEGSVELLDAIGEAIASGAI